MTDINKEIIKYINETWLNKSDNNSQFAREHDLDEKTIRSIRTDENYRISLNTLIKICKAEKISLEDFCRKAGV